MNEIMAVNRPGSGLNDVAILVGLEQADESTKLLAELCRAAGVNVGRVGVDELNRAYEFLHWLIHLPDESRLELGHILWRLTADWAEMGFPARR